MEHLGITLLAVFVFAFGLISKRLQSTSLTAPMIFAAFGVIVGPLGFGLVELDTDSDVLRTLAEATLVLVLFADASVIDLQALRKNLSVPLRLLGIGLPLSIVLGTLTASVLFPDLSVWHAALIAAILAPTDAALGQAVVSNPGVPSRIRQALNVESGLNDGICLPFVFMFLALATGDHSQPLGYWAEFASAQLVLGPLAGIAVGFAGAKSINRAVRSSWISPAFQRLSSLVLALLSFCFAEWIGGNGFIAAFVAGITFGNTVDPDAGEKSLEFAEAEGQLIGLFAFLAFGAAGISPAVMEIGPTAILFAVLSLTLIRMLPVSIALLGGKLGWSTHLFLGWFGPRGLASILYVLIAVESESLPGAEIVFAVVMCTVLLSVLLHGITAGPGAAMYATRVKRRQLEMAVCAENQHVDEMPARQLFRG